MTRVLTYQDFERRNSACNQERASYSREEEEEREAGLEYRGHRKCSSGINKAIVDYGSDTRLRSVAYGRGAAGRRAVRGVAEGQGEDGPGGVGDSGATPR